MHCSIEHRVFDERGQSTVEAAFVLPIIFALFALLLQPAVLLYDRCVMESAAAETCRLLATRGGDEAVRAFALRRLAVLPSLDLFHKDACVWQVSYEGGGGCGPVSVSIEGHLKVLPLLGITASSLTDEAGDGCAAMRCRVESTLYPSWLCDAGSSPSEWIGQWD